MSIHSPRLRRMLAVVAAWWAAVAAAPALACSTGAALSIDEIAQSAKVIVLADVLRAEPNGLNYDLRIIERIRGDVAAGEVLTIGPASVPTSISAFPDCWLALPVGERVVLALTEPDNLDALASWAWWEQDGQLVTASAVEPETGTTDTLLARLRSRGAMPATDAAADLPSPASTPGAVFLVGLTGAVACLAATWRLRRPRTR